MRDVKFIEQIHDILDEKHFDNEAIKWIVKNCKEYYNPKLCAFVRKDKVCLKKKKPKPKAKPKNNG